MILGNEDLDPFTRSVNSSETRIRDYPSPAALGYAQCYVNIKNMNEPQDIPQPSQEQEAILQRAPFLKAFITQPVDISGKWLDKLDPLGDPLEKEIETKLGNNWLVTTLGPITLMVLEQDVFDTKLMKTTGQKEGQDELVTLVESLFLIGYEVGNRKDAYGFCVPIIDKLSKSGLLHYPVPENEVESYSQRIFSTVWGIVQAGAFIRINIDEKEDQPKGTQFPKNPFKDFIQDLGSIDELPPEDTGIK